MAYNPFGFFAARTVEPAAQASADDYADVTGSILDALHCTTVSYTIVNAHASRAIKWKVIASNDAAFAATVEAQAEAEVAGEASGSYGSTTAVWRYYKVQVKSSAGSAPASVTVRGVAKI